MNQWVDVSVYSSRSQWMKWSIRERTGL